MRPMDRFIDAVADSDKGGVVEKICSLRKNV